MSNAYLGEIRIFAGNFAPQGWATCSGNLMLITQNTALYSLLGTFYGGNGTTTFGLPNLQGSAPVGQGIGNGGGLDMEIGESQGSATVALNTGQLPQHTHGLVGTTTLASTQVPTGNVPAVASRPIYGGTGTTMNAGSLAVIGAGQSHNNVQPILALTFIISLTGIFPLRP